MNRILLLLFAAGFPFGQDWPVYGGDAGGSGFRRLRSPGISRKVFVMFQNAAAPRRSY
jgi:hypothetical protein